MLRKLFFLLVIFSFSLSAQNKSQSIGFKENKGQIIDQKGKPNPSVRFLLNSDGLNVQLKKNGFSYDVYETKKIPLTEKDGQRQEISIREEKKNTLPDYSLEYSYHRVDIDFEGSNPNVELIAEEKSKDYDNYYTLKYAPEGILMVHQFKKVIYKNLYPNIDVVFFVPEDATKTVEYNFIIHPGGKASDIRMKFNGVKTDLVDQKIKMETRFGTMEETLPLSWTENGKTRNEIAVEYKKIKKNVYGFAVEEVVTSDKTIVIDPVPIRLWGTYYGGASNEVGRVNINNSFLYLYGYTASTTNIATSGSHQQTYEGIRDGLLVKFSSNQERLWSTYYGGSKPEYFYDTAFDINGNIYVVGETHSTTNIATLNSHQTEYYDWGDGMIIKFTPDGVRVWGTYYGHNNIDSAYCVEIDANQNLYVAGETYSIANIATPGSYRSEVELATGGSNQVNDGFLAKFDLDGQRIWATYYGGDSNEGIISMSLDSNQNIFCFGHTTGSGNPEDFATPGAHQPILNYDINTGVSFDETFIVKFSPEGERLFGTFFGGYQYDFANSIKVDHDDNFIISGLTRSSNYISTPGSHQPALGGPPIEPDSFISKFTNNGVLLWSTYYGGENFEDYGSELDVDENNNIYFYGGGNSENNITTPDAYQESLIPNYNFNKYIVKFSPEGERIWGSYFAGGQNGNIAYEGNGIFYISGRTSKIDGIASPGSFQNILAGSDDAFIIKFKDCLSFTDITSNSPVCIGNTLELTATGGTDYIWTGPNGFTSILQNPTIPSAATLNSGEYFCTITGTGGCDDTLSVVVTVGDIVAPVPDIATLPTITGTCDSLTIPIPTAVDACMGAIVGTTTDPLTYTQVGTYTIVWNYTDGSNSTSQNQTIVINPQPLPVANTTPFFCIQENKTLADITITGQDIKWYDAQTGGNILPDTTLLDDDDTYYASQTINGCESERLAVTPTIQNTFGPTGFAVQYFCDTQNLTLADFVLTGTDIVFYDSQFGGTILPMNTPLVDDMGYWASQTVNGCENSLRTPFISDIISDLPANDYTMSVCDNLNDGKEKVDLSDYHENIIPASNGYSFSYYTNFNGAENEIAASEITNFSDYELALGMNTIYVRVENTTLCYKVVILQLNVIATPILYMADTYGMCEGASKTITADPGFYTYTWSTGELSQSITVTQPGTYAVTVTEYHGDVICGTTKSITVVASNKATITSIETSDWTSDENMLNVFVTGLGNYEYSIDGENYQTSNQFTGLENGEYTVYVRDINGCGIVKDDVYLLMYPKFFSPNGDGYNDSWGIRFYQNEMKMVVKIFDRYGKFIKLLTDTDPVWDGTYNGQISPATDYWFSVIREDGKEHTGHFSLKR